MKKTVLALAPYLEEGIRIIITIFAVAAILIFIGEKSLAVFYRYSLDYGEAPLVDQAMRLAAGQTIYRSDLATPPYTISNYPPLYPLAMTPFIALFGPAFWPGRLISALSALATAFFLARIVYDLTGERFAARVAGALFLAIPYVVGWSSLARVDLLALALSTAGLAVLVRHAAARRGLLAAAVLLVAAVYTRQSYGLAAPLAAGVWVLYRHGWRRAFALAGMVAGLGLALLLTLNLATQGGFIFNIVTANVNPFNQDTLLHHWRDVRDLFPILLTLGALGGGCALWTLWDARKQDHAGTTGAWLLAIPYLIGGAASAATIGKVGSNINYLLELMAALSLTAGVWAAGNALPRTARAPLVRQIARNLALLLIAAQMGLLMRDTLLHQVQELKGRRQPEVRLGDLLYDVRQADDPVLADEFMGMLTLNGKPLYIQPFEMTQLANAGLWDQRPLLDAIRRQEFSMILIHHYMGYPVYLERWTPEMLRVIFRYYTADAWMGETVVFRPRDTAVDPLNLAICPERAWRLPSRADMGVWWLTQGLILMGQGHEGTVAVQAVADGVLMRRADWHDAVAILHDDPTRPGEQVWTYYSGMASGWDGRSLVAMAYPPGATGVRVRRGQFLGYQGQADWNGMRLWSHVFFGVAQPLSTDGSFPLHLLSAAPPPTLNDPATFLDPTPYLGTAIHSPVMGKPVWFPLRCLDYVEP